MGFVDLHAHVLPRVDDGPKDLVSSVDLLRAVYEDGTRVVVATPHMFLHPFGNEDPGALWGAYLGLLTSLDRLKLDPETAFLGELSVYLGAEHFFSFEFLNALEAGKVLPLKDTRFLLVEFSPFFSADEIVAGVRQILGAGFVPIVAHAERYLGFQRRPERVRELRDLGCVIQVNAESLVGWLPSRRSRSAWSMVQAGLVDIVASDSHNTRSRRPRLRQAESALSRRVSPDVAAVLLTETPSSLIGL